MSRLTHIDNLPVVDAKRPITIHVTRADIAKAANSIQEPDKCAVARACYRDLHVLEARIHRSRAYLRTNANNWVRYIVPLAMKWEIFSFDRGGTFEPQEFTLLKPSPADKLNAKRKTGPRKAKGKKRQAYHRLVNVRSSPL